MNFPSGTDFFAYARYYLWACIDSDRPDEVVLLTALDGLAFAFHWLPAGKPARQTVERVGDAQYALIARRFDGLGYYAVADSLKVGIDQALVGDAIDDLADIADTMQEAVFRLDTNGPEDAAAYLHMLRYHWLGDHLRPLAAHLEARVFNSAGGGSSQTASGI